MIAADPEMDPSVKLQKLTHLAEMCVDLIQENNEHYAEVCFVFQLFFVFLVVFAIFTLIDLANYLCVAN